MRVLVFEDDNNEYGPYNFANALGYNGELNIDFKSKSQQVNVNMYSQYDAIFVDIQLARTSAKDGFAILEDIRDNHRENLRKVVVVTGFSFVEERLESMGLKDKVQVIIKPISFKEILDSLHTIFADKE